MSAIDDVLIAKILTNDGTPSTVTIYPIQDGVTLAFDATIVAVDVNGNSSSWTMFGCAKNFGGTPVLVGVSNVGCHPADTAASTWTVVLGVDTTGLNATLTGSGNVDINWTIRSRVTITP